MRSTPLGMTSRLCVGLTGVDDGGAWAYGDFRRRIWHPAAEKTGLVGVTECSRTVTAVRNLVSPAFECTEGSPWTVFALDRTKQVGWPRKEAQTG